MPWHKIRRPSQTPPETPWRVWLILAGRGWGKTRTGAEWIREQVRLGFRYCNLIGATADDARDIMIDGESGVLAVCPPSERPTYKRNERKLIWPNGAESLVFTADEPERLRGKQHTKLWADEICAWRYPESWHQAMLGLRLGTNPQALATTTPKPTKLLRELMELSTTTVTRGTTYENAANLAPGFIEQIIRRYEGTRLGLQELEARILEDAEGALWSRATLEDCRISACPDLVRVVVAVDPAATSSEDSDETGIVVAGLGIDGHGYVLDDRTLRGSPAEWAGAAVAAYSVHRADRIIAEVNNGGEMVAHTIRTVDPRVPVHSIHASRGKRTRAEPVAALYEQSRIHHLGVFAELEDQMCSWAPGDKSSPDRMDALVWAFSDLMLADVTQKRVAPTSIVGVRGGRRG